MFCFYLCVAVFSWLFPSWRAVCASSIPSNLFPSSCAACAADVPPVADREQRQDANADSDDDEHRAIGDVRPDAAQLDMPHPRDLLDPRLRGE